MELEVYKKSDFYEDYISSQKEYYERENADAYFAEKLAEKDKEIAEKDAVIAGLIEKNKRLANKDMIMASETIKGVFDELHHHKYKRCRAMVKYCHESAMWLEEYGVTKYATFMLRWEKRWLELAEKFKEVK
jgi:hypothetical protein